MLQEIGEGKSPDGRWSVLLECLIGNEYRAGRRCNHVHGRHRGYFRTIRLVYTGYPHDGDEEKWIR